MEKLIFLLQETLSTCKFAQRVSLLKTEPVINEISNSVEEIVYLTSRVKELEEKLASLTKLNVMKRHLLPLYTFPSKLIWHSMILTLSIFKIASN